MTLAAITMAIADTVEPSGGDHVTAATDRQPPTQAFRAPHPPIGAAAPSHLDIPALRVSAPVGRVGLNPDGRMQVPPEEPANLTAWFDRSVTPGERGPSVIVGHVDTYRGGSVFYELRTLQPGQIIDITRDDGRTTTFQVDHLKVVAKDTFPTTDVYGLTEHPTLRLITCGGRFDHDNRRYLDNVVVFATLVDVR